MTTHGGSGALKFHHDFGTSLESLEKSRRFRTAIAHSSLLFRSNAICTWIPKVACSSLRYSVARANGMLGPSHSVHWIHKNNTAFRPQLRDCFDADYSFIFLRCPLERIVSAFLDKLVDDERAATFREPFGKVLGHPQIEAFFSFRDFVKTIIQFQLSNEHWQPQAEFLLFDTYSDYFALSDLARAKDILMEKIGFSLEDTRPLIRHDTSHLRPVSVFKAHDLSIAELQGLKSRGLAPTKRSFLSPELVADIRTHWKPDFELFERLFGRPRLWEEVGLTP